MQVHEKGHIYTLDNNNMQGQAQTLMFVNKEPGSEHEGTTTQEVLRALIDRTRHCNNCMPHPNNERIVYHLRMALVLHEARALERRTEKGEIRPEYLPTKDGGHILLSSENVPRNATSDLIKAPLDGAKEPSYGESNARS